MTEEEFLAERFEEHRLHLRKVAYRMLGSVAEADDAVQEAWLRLSRSDADEIENLRALADDRRRPREPERPALAHHPRRGTARRGPRARPAALPRERVRPRAGGAAGRQRRARAARRARDATPAERLAFVLHDMFAVPFDEIAPMVGRSSTATRQLASRARRRVQGEAPQPTDDLPKQRAVVDAFFAAARDGDFDALVAVLHPDAVLRSDGGALRPAHTVVRHGAEEIARNAMRFAHLSDARPAGAGQRRRGRRRRAARRALHGHGLHRRRRPDRGDRRGVGPGAPAQAGPLRALISQSR